MGLLIQERGPVHLRATSGQVDTELSGNQKSSFRTPSLQVNNVPQKKLPCLCDCFRQKLLKTDAQGTERGSAYPRVNGSDPVREVCGAWSKAAALEDIKGPHLAWGPWRRHSNEITFIYALLIQNHFYDLERVWTHASIFRHYDNRQRSRLSLLRRHILDALTHVNNQPMC